MRRREVRLAPSAEDDLYNSYLWLTERAGRTVAERYIRRLEAFCSKLELGAECGTLRDDLRAGLRMIGFERRVAIAFTTTGDEVIVLRIVYGGQDWEQAF